MSSSLQSHSVLSEAQLSYLGEVLGVKSVILPALSNHMLGVSPIDEDVVAPQLSRSHEAMFRSEGDLPSSRLICLFHESDLWPLEGERAEMASKMIQAMKLSSADVFKVEWRGDILPEMLRDQLLSAGARPVLVFGITGASALLGSTPKLGEFFDLEGVHVIPTHSLSEMTAQPNLKRPTWAHMQSVMKILI